jgi:hypothetical protein
VSSVSNSVGPSYHEHTYARQQQQQQQETCGSNRHTHETVCQCCLPGEVTQWVLHCNIVQYDTGSLPHLSSVQYSCIRRGTPSVRQGTMQSNTAGHVCATVKAHWLRHFCWRPLLHGVSRQRGDESDYGNETMPQAPTEHPFSNTPLPPRFLYRAPPPPFCWRPILDVVPRQITPMGVITSLSQR